MPLEEWIKTAISRPKLGLADGFGRENFSFLKQHHKQVMPHQLLLLPIGFASLPYVILSIPSNYTKYSVGCASLKQKSDSPRKLLDVDRKLPGFGESES